MLIDLSCLKKESKFTKACNEYRFVYADDIGNNWFEDIFHSACVVEVIDRNTLYFLPAGYSQKHGNTNRQQYYIDLFVNSLVVRTGKYLINYESHNPYDKYAIGFYYKSDNAQLHLGYVPSPLNILVAGVMRQQQRHKPGAITINPVFTKQNIHGKYIAPVFKWEVELSNVLGNATQNRFAALLLEDD